MVVPMDAACRSNQNQTILDSELQADADLLTHSRQLEPEVYRIDVGDADEERPQGRDAGEDRASDLQRRERKRAGCYEPVPRRGLAGVSRPVVE